MHEGGTDRQAIRRRADRSERRNHMNGRSPIAAHEAFFSTTAADIRADRGRRDIEISTERVTIRRRLHGIDMRLSLGLTAYRGVALCLRPGGGDRLIYQVRLIHRDHDLSVLLDEAPDDRDIIADWRLWARVLGRPALVEREVGRFEPASADPASGEEFKSIARRKRPLKRRPRFLTRRRVGRPTVEPVLHGEREIIART